MTVRTRLQPRFLIQRIAMIVICLVLGLWGVYDYVWAIPSDQAMSDRRPVYEAAYEAIRLTGDPDATEAEVEAAVEEAGRLLAESMAAVPEGVEADMGENAALRPLDEEQWAAELALMGATVAGYAQLPADAEVPQVLADGARMIEARKNRTAGITPPSKFDRLTQWFFILCLPFAPWYAWTFVRELRTVHALEEDGAFVGPHGRWERDEIADVDMSEWMRRSVAWVVHEDGQREKLDDYVHRGVDAIVGSIAHRLHPEAWTPEAKPVKKDEEAPGDRDTVAASDAAPDAVTAVAAEGPEQPTEASGAQEQAVAAAADDASEARRRA